MRILGITEEERLDGLSDVPTFKEQGYPIVTPALFSFAFPKGTPRPIVDRFVDAQKKAIGKYRKELAEELRKVEQWADFRSPEATLEAYRVEHDVYFKIAQDLGWAAK